MSRRQPGSLAPLSAKLAPLRESVRDNNGGSASAAQSTSAVKSPGTNPRGISLVVVDPQTLFRRGLGLLVRQWYPAAAIFDAADVSQLLVDMGLRPRPELLIVDAAIACRWNFAGLSQLLARLPSAPIVLLADEVDANAAIGAIELGARGYLAKRASEEVLRHALALAMAGEIYLPREQLSASAPQAGSPCGASPDSPLRRLTYRQREVLSHLALGRSNKEIARCLGLIESTVKVHVKTILKKLAATNRTQAAMLAVEMGWARRLDA
jgi:two-component system nitrate/nitrite response regulator NarL